VQIVVLLLGRLERYEAVFVKPSRALERMKMDVAGIVPLAGLRPVDRPLNEITPPRHLADKILRCPKGLFLGEFVRDVSLEALGDLRVPLSLRAHRSVPSSLDVLGAAKSVGRLVRGVEPGTPNRLMALLAMPAKLPKVVRLLQNLRLLERPIVVQHPSHIVSVALARYASGCPDDAAAMDRHPDIEPK
jgi:hypothetical protein